MVHSQLLTRPQTASAKFVPVENFGRWGLDIDVLIFGAHAVSSKWDTVKCLILSHLEQADSKTEF